MNNTSGTTEGTIKTFLNDKELLKALMNDANQLKSTTPIIIIKDDCHTDQIENFIQQVKPDKVAFGGDWKNLQDIRTWQSGLLVLDADEGVGTDTKFAKDAIVFILAEVKKSSVFQ